jgi:hypothetical protein
VPHSHHSLALDASADAAFDRSVRTERPLFIAGTGTGGRRNAAARGRQQQQQQESWGVLPQKSSSGGRLDGDGDGNGNAKQQLWQVSARKTAYFEVAVGPPSERIPERAPHSECVAIGFVNRGFVLAGRQPGWDAQTWCAH